MHRETIGYSNEPFFVFLSVKENVFCKLMVITYLQVTEAVQQEKIAKIALLEKIPFKK